MVKALKVLPPHVSGLADPVVEVDAVGQPGGEDTHHAHGECIDEYPEDRPNGMDRFQMHCLGISAAGGVNLYV